MSPLWQLQTPGPRKRIAAPTTFGSSSPLSFVHGSWVAIAVDLRSMSYYFQYGANFRVCRGVAAIEHRDRQAWPSKTVVASGRQLLLQTRPVSVRISANQHNKACFRADFSCGTPR